MSASDCSIVCSIGAHDHCLNTPCACSCHREEKKVKQPEPDPGFVSGLDGSKKGKKVKVKGAAEGFTSKVDVHYGEVSMAEERDAVLREESEDEATDDDR